MCLQVLQWLIVHADTIQSLLRCQELSMGVLQELSLLTGIISKTALPGTSNKSSLFTIDSLLYFPISIMHSTHSYVDYVNDGSHLLLGLSGALEMGGEVNSAALMEFQGHINRFQVSV